MARKATAVAAALWTSIVALSCAELLDEAQQHYCSGPCTRGGATASLSWALRGSGAHREVVYRLDVRCPSLMHPGRASDGSAAGADGAPPVPSPPPACLEAAFLQPLSPGIFADIYQLDNAAAKGQGPAVRLFGPVDVESIERHSGPTVLAVLASGGNSAGQTTGIGQEGAGSVCSMHALSVPLHARYPHPQALPQTKQQEQQQGAAWWQATLSVPVSTEIALPLVLVRCATGSRGERSQWQAARLQPAAGATAAEQQLPVPLRWDRPAGNLRHGPVVAGGTAVALLLGVAAVLRALCGPAVTLLSSPGHGKRD